MFKRPTVKQKTKKPLKPLNHKALRNLAIAFAIVIVSVALYVKCLMPHTLEAKQRLQLESTQSQLLQTKEQLEEQQVKSKKEDAKKAKELEELNKKLQETEKQLQAKKDAQATAYAAATPHTAVVYQLPEDEAKAFIYSHESGNNPGSINSGSGACGLGQALPCSKLPCSLSDYACQDAWFTNYMKERYGTWNNARAFWIANNWW